VTHQICRYPALGFGVWLSGLCPLSSPHARKKNFPRNFSTDRSPQTALHSFTNSAPIATVHPAGSVSRTYPSKFQPICMCCHFGIGVIVTDALLASFSLSLPILCRLIHRAGSPSVIHTSSSISNFSSV